MALIEKEISDFLNSVPQIKKIVKRLYQLGMYAISPKIKSEGNIEKVSPNDGMERICINLNNDIISYCS